MYKVVISFCKQNMLSLKKYNSHKLIAYLNEIKNLIPSFNDCNVALF